MVVIRLSRHGARNRPFYHVVVADQRHPRDGRYIERLGYFNPKASGQDKKLEINLERFQHWVKQGAQPSSRILTLVKSLQA